MEKIILLFIVAFTFVEATYALPIGILFLGYDFFLFFFGFVASGVVALFFYFKHLSFKKKIGIFGVLILLFFPLRYFYIEYKKSYFIQEYYGYIDTITVDYQSDNNTRVDYPYMSNIEELSIEKIKENEDQYIFIDIRETSEVEVAKQYEKYDEISFQHIRVPDLIKNYNSIFGDTKKPIIVACIAGDRSKLVAGLLQKKGHSVYFIEGGMRSLGTYGENNIMMKYQFCENIDVSDKFIINVGANKQPAGISIPYMQITDDEVRGILNKSLDNYIVKIGDPIAITCNVQEHFSCSVGRESVALILEHMGFTDFCISRDVLF